MKLTKVHNTVISIEETNKGLYTLRGVHEGKHINTHTNDSEIYDWLNCSSNKEKHSSAKSQAYTLIVNRYKELYR